MFIFSITSNRLKENVRHSLWAKVMWPQGPVGKVNTASKELFTHLMEAHKTAGVDIDHGTLALDKAAVDMKRATDLQKNMIKGAGLPWWGLALVLFMLGSGLLIAVLAVNASRRVDETIGFNPMQIHFLKPKLQHASHHFRRKTFAPIFVLKIVANFGTTMFRFPLMKATGPDEFAFCLEFDPPTPAFLILK